MEAAKYRVAVAGVGETEGLSIRRVIMSLALTDDDVDEIVGLQPGGVCRTAAGDTVVREKSQEHTGGSGAAATVGELKELIKDLPDDLPVYIFDDGLSLVAPVLEKELAYQYRENTYWQPATFKPRPNAFPCLLINAH